MLIIRFMRQKNPFASIKAILGFDLKLLLKIINAKLLTKAAQTSLGVSLAELRD